MTVARAVSLGIGSMVGAGVFALLGEVGAVAALSVWLAFLGGGVVALLNGYSYGRLAASADHQAPMRRRCNQQTYAMCSTK